LKTGGVEKVDKALFRVHEGKYFAWVESHDAPADLQVANLLPAEAAIVEIARSSPNIVSCNPDSQFL
jgi:hypothetical protein